MRLGLACLLLVGLAASPAPVAPGTPVGAPQLRRILDRPVDLRVAGRRIGAVRLRAFYTLRDFAAAWDPSDRGGERSDVLLRVLSRAADHGLDPTAYHLDAVSPQARNTSALDRELLLTDALLRYARDVRIGRVRPGSIDEDWGIPAPTFDVVAEAVRAMESEALATWLAELPPGHRDYRLLAEALVRYRSRVASVRSGIVSPGRTLEPGVRDGRVAALRRRLAVEEEDEDGLRAPAARLYDPALEGAVRRFQARHGLAADGLVGPLTRRALNVPLAARVRQIELNLERWRWLPRDLGPRYLTVNAAAATLTVVEEPGVVLASRVVVGDARHPTPVLEARVQALVLNPAWTIPESIVAEEILPELQRNPRYLADHDIVVLDRLDADPFGLTVDWSRVSARTLPRLQQRPGAGNPLGRIRFDLPNRFAVYLHDTPATALFLQPVRTRSHGCVRVERAVELATRLLAGQDLGDRDHLERALATGATRRVAVDPPWPVYLLYWTAFVEEGMLHFRDDVYGRDRRLAAALGHAGARATGPDPASAAGCVTGTPP